MLRECMAEYQDELFDMWHEEGLEMRRNERKMNAFWMRNRKNGGPYVVRKDGKEESDKLEYCIIGESAWNKMSEVYQEIYRGRYERQLLIVPDHFFTVINDKEYPQKPFDNARLICDLHDMTTRYVFTPKMKALFKLVTTGVDFKLHTTGCKWTRDEGLSMLKAEMASFTMELADMANAIPATSPKKKVGRKSDDSDDDVAAIRNARLYSYKEVIEGRHANFAGTMYRETTNRLTELLTDADVQFNDLDVTGTLVPCINGCYDLATHQFKSTDPASYLTYCIPTTYDPAAKSEVVNKFLADITCGRDNIKNYLAQLLGAALDSRESKRPSPQLFGSQTNNGKTTLINALEATLGNSADEGGLVQTLETRALKAGKPGDLTPDLARIKTARIVFMSEPKEGFAVDEAQWKTLTGDNKITINDKYEKGYDIVTRFTIFWETNHLIRIGDATLFMRDTVKIVPFDMVLDKKDVDNSIVAKLKADDARSTFLNWILDGHRQFVANGKRAEEPDVCKQMVQDYAANSDRIKSFISQSYIQTKNKSQKVLLKDAFDKYVDWCADNGYHPEGYSEFQRKINNRFQAYMGKKHNRICLCGFVEYSADMAESADPFAGMAPLDWYLEKQLIQDVRAISSLETIYKDYAKKVQAAGETPLEFWAFYGTLMGRGLNIQMGTPGDAGSITVTGWRIMSQKDREELLAYRLRMKEDEIRRNTQATLEALPAETRQALEVLMRGPGLDDLLKDADDAVKEFITGRLVQGFGEDFLLMNIASGLVEI